MQKISNGLNSYFEVKFDPKGPPPPRKHNRIFTKLFVTTDPNLLFLGLKLCWRDVLLQYHSILVNYHGDIAHIGCNKSSTFLNKMD